MGIDTVLWVSTRDIYRFLKVAALSVVSGRWNLRLVASSFVW